MIVPRVIDVWLIDVCLIDVMSGPLTLRVLKPRALNGGGGEDGASEDTHSDDDDEEDSDDDDDTTTTDESDVSSVNEVNEIDQWLMGESPSANHRKKGRKKAKIGGGGGRYKRVNEDEMRSLRGVMSPSLTSIRLRDIPSMDDHFIIALSRKLLNSPLQDDEEESEGGNKPDTNAATPYVDLHSHAPPIHLRSSFSQSHPDPPQSHHARLKLKWTYLGKGPI